MCACSERHEHRNQHGVHENVDTGKQQQRSGGVIGIRNSAVPRYSALTRDNAA
jgi:hypothetical protein